MRICALQLVLPTNPIGTSPDAPLGVIPMNHSSSRSYKTTADHLSTLPLGFVFPFWGRAILTRFRS